MSLLAKLTCRSGISLGFSFVLVLKDWDKIYYMYKPSNQLLAPPSIHRLLFPACSYVSRIVRSRGKIIHQSPEQFQSPQVLLWPVDFPGATYSRTYFTRTGYFATFLCRIATIFYPDRPRSAIFPSNLIDHTHTHTERERERERETLTLSSFLAFLFLFSGN